MTSITLLCPRRGCMNPQPCAEHRPGRGALLYGRRWQRARLAFLRSHPLCVTCETMGRVTEATEVDHIRPHRGDLVLFWDADGNWQALCKPHHSAKTRRGE